MKHIPHRRFLTFILVSLLSSEAFIVATSTGAQTGAPAFQKCEDALKVPTNNFVNYGLADYGVPGKGVIRGVDQVQYLRDKNMLQCFCPQSGSVGTQSDWWNASKLTPAEIEQFKKEGWMYLAPHKDGNVYDIPYMVKNRDYACKTPSITPTPIFSPTPVMPTQTPIPTNTVTPTHTNTSTPTKTSTPSHTVTPTLTKTPTSTGTVTSTPTNIPTVTNTNTPTGTQRPSQTPTITPSVTNTVSPTHTPTVTASPTVTPPATTQLKLCKYEDDNGDGAYQNGEDVLSWKFTITYDGQAKTVESHWWHIWTQGCAITDVPTGKSITVTEESKSGWRATALFADGEKTSNGTSYTYSSSPENVKVLWFLNTFTPQVHVSPTSPGTATVTPTISLTATPTITPTVSITHTKTPTPTVQATLTPTTTPTVTSTISVTPSLTQTGTPTVSPTPGPTSVIGSCSNLAINPSSGGSPLTVSFTGYGNDPRGDIQGYEFNFGDNSQVVQQTGNTITHTYNATGTYTAQLRIKDSTGNWRDGNNDCRRTITVSSQSQVLGTTTELPKTGGMVGIVGVLMTIGWVIRRKFFIV